MKRYMSVIALLLLPLAARAEQVPLTHLQAQGLYYNSHGRDLVTDRIGIGNPAGGVLYGDPDDGYSYLCQSHGSTMRVTREDRLPTHWFPFRDTDWDGDGSKDGLRAYDEDGVVLTAVFSRATTGTYLGADGLLHTAAIDEPRYGYYNMTSLTYGGLLLEYNGTNYIEYSEAFNNWPASAVTVTADTASAPVFGNTTSADALRATDAAGFVSYSTSATASNYYCFSVYLKGASDVSGAYISVGKVSDGFTNYSTPLTTDWQRFDVSANLTTASEGVEARVYLGQTTVDVYAFGGQVEATSFPTSYVPTAGSTVTRGRDDCWFPKPTGFDIAGTIVVDWTPLWADADYYPGNRHILHWSTDSGFPQNYLSLLYQFGDSSISTSVGFSDTGAAKTGDIYQARETGYKYSVQWSTDGGTCTVARDGAVVVTDAYDGDFYQSAAHPNIGLGLGNTGFIRNLIIFDRSDVEVNEW